jgi:hypothetical protein
MSCTADGIRATVRKMVRDKFGAINSKKIDMEREIQNLSIAEI